MFFICHSLGGLVTCQVRFDEFAGQLSKPSQMLVTLLNRQRPINTFEDSFANRFFHHRNDRCLVRGITFFATPFEGSILANVIAPIVHLFSGKTTFVASLTLKNSQRRRMVKEFDESRLKQETRIGLRIFYETKKVKKLFIKTMVSLEESLIT